MVEDNSSIRDGVTALYCTFIGFGKSTARRRLPYVLHRKDRWHMVHIYRRRAKPEEQAPQYSHIRFTSDFDDVLNDPQVSLVVVCTHASSHFEYAKKALEAGRNVLVEKSFTPTPKGAKALFPPANSKGLTVTPYQDRRFDSRFLTTKKVIKSRKLGGLVEIESHFDSYRPVTKTNPSGPQDGEFYDLGVHIPDRIISLFGRSDHVFHNLCSLRNEANLDDIFEAQLSYGGLKATVKISHLVQINYPKFTVHSHKGSFVRYDIDQQETSLKTSTMPDEPSSGADDSVGELVYISKTGGTVRKAVPLETNDYGRVYNALYETLVNNQPNYVKESDVPTNMEILERDSEQSFPVTITLTK